MPARSFISALIYSIRPIACIGSSFFAIASLGKWDDVSVIILTFFSAFFGACGCFLINDIFDREKDLKNNKLRPIATGEIPVRTAFIIAVICCLTMSVLSFFLSFNTYILSALLIIGFWLYPYINQRFGLFSNIWVSACASLAFIYGAILYDITPLIYFATFFTFFEHIGREILLDALDVKGDQAVGKPSIPITYGEKRTVVIVAIFFALASLVVIGYLLYFPTTWPWMSAMLLLIWVPFFMKKTEGFRKWALFNVRVSHVLFIVLIVILFVKPADKQTAPPNITAEYCLDKLEQLQSKKDGFYPIGTFPTKRFWLSKKGDDDNNIFGTATIAYTLRSINERHPNQQNMLMVNKAVRSFELYRNRHGKASYNFWKTGGHGLHFPNSIISFFEKYSLVDDYDDSALIQLARGPHAMDKPVRDMMVKYAMRPNRSLVEHFPSKYPEKTYESLYVSKMQQELDIVAMANTLLFVFEKGYPLETPDRHTINCLKKAIEEKWYFKDPTAYALYYCRPEIILYCLARLIDKDTTGEFALHRRLLIQDLRQAINQTDQSIEKVIIASSLLRLGEPLILTLSRDQVMKDAHSFPYTIYTSTFMNLHIIPTFYWRSEAVSWALVYELLSFNPTIHWE